MIAPQEIKDKALIFIREQHFAVLATASAKGEPQAATMSFFVDNEFTFYFISTNGSRKLENLKNNDTVAIVVGFGPHPMTIQGGGEAKIIKDVPDDLFQKIVGSVPNADITKWPITKLAKNGFSTIVIRPSWLEWLDLNPDSATYQEDFYKII